MGAASDVYVLFNNDPLGCAEHHAAVFAQREAGVGLSPTRAPPVRELTVG